MIKDPVTKNRATRRNNRVNPVKVNPVKADESAIKFPLWVGGLLFAAVALSLGLNQVEWQPADLPAWFWVTVFVTGGLGTVGAFLIRQATPERTLGQRALMIGVGWGLPLAFAHPLLPLLTGRPFDWISLPIWGIAAACFGYFMARLGNRS